MVHDCGPNQSEDGTGWIEIFGAAKGAGAAKDEGRDASSAENEGGSDVSRAVDLHFKVGFTYCYISIS